MATPGGQGWTDNILLGGEADDFRLMWPDIRLPANQYWPLHWHDCWTAVVVVEGQVLIGDWWMEEGDVFITRPKLEYGPLVAGPSGVRLFEIFANADLAPGGYAPEYFDHPTLRGTQKQFFERTAENKRNDGRMSLPCDNVEGAFKARLGSQMHWNLGADGDPQRGVLIDAQLAPGEAIAPHMYGDWHLIAVMEGSLEIQGMILNKDDFLRIAPDSPVAVITAGKTGARLLEGARTSHGATRRPLA